MRIVCYKIAIIAAPSVKHTIVWRHVALFIVRSEYYTVTLHSINIYFIIYNSK